MRATAFIIHMFSGRRRHRDIQGHIEKEFAAADFNTRVVSMDIIYAKKGDLTRKGNMDFWLAKIKDRQILGII